MMTRKSYSSEYKLEAVRLADASGNTSQTARDLGIRAEMIRRWRKQFEEHGKRAFPGHGSPRDEELANLRRTIESSRAATKAIETRMICGGLSRTFSDLEAPKHRQCWREPQSWPLRPNRTDSRSGAQTSLNPCAAVVNTTLR